MIANILAGLMFLGLFLMAVYMVLTIAEEDGFLAFVLAMVLLPVFILPFFADSKDHPVPVVIVEGGK